MLDFQRARRPVALDPDAGPDPDHRPEAGGAARRAHVRPPVVGPGGHQRLGREPSRSRVPVRLGRRPAVQLDERH